MKRPRTAEEKSAAQSLQSFISELSERHFQAEWHTGCEFALWEAAIYPDTNRHFAINEEDRSHLAILAHRAGGWWYWPEDARDVRFVPIEEWRQIHSDREKGIDRALLRHGAHYVLRYVQELRDEAVSGEWRTAEYEKIIRWIVAEFGEPLEL